MRTISGCREQWRLGTSEWQDVFTGPPRLVTLGRLGAAHQAAEAAGRCVCHLHCRCNQLLLCDGAARSRLPARSFPPPEERLERAAGRCRCRWGIHGSFCPAGLMPLHGIKHKLRYVNLHSNCIDSIHHLLQCVVGLHFLTHLILEKDGQDNPVCRLPGRALAATVVSPSGASPAAAS